MNITALSGRDDEVKLQRIIMYRLGFQVVKKPALACCLFWAGLFKAPTIKLTPTPG